MTVKRVEVFAQLAASDKLQQRRLEMLPLRGPGAVFTEPQGRAPGPMSAPEDLVDLISSIAAVGLLQPVLVEESAAMTGGRPTLRLVSGERRLRAMRWGATHLAEAPQFAAIPAVVCPGPLEETERRCWQLVENVAREDLQPGELAAALLLERCAIATAKLLAAGRQASDLATHPDDPVARWHRLERLRGGDSSCAAPWAEVLQRLGLQLSPRKARQLVRAFAALPREISEEMDEAKVALHTRITFVALRQGRQAAADEIWAAVKQHGRQRLLPAAVRAMTEKPGVNADQALDTAQREADDANLARAQKLLKDGESISPDTAGDPTSTVQSATVADAVTACRALLSELRAGRQLHRYDAGSLRLLLAELMDLVSADDPGSG